MIAPPDATDCHAHVFSCALPMAPDARYRPTADAPLDDFIALLDRHGIGRGVLVQPSFLGTDNSFMLAALSRYPARLRGVAVVDPAVTTAALEALRVAGIRGLRFNLLGRSVPDFGAPDLQRFLKRVAGAGLHLELHAEGAAWPTLLPPLLDAAIPFVIDHFGRPASADPRQDAGFAAVVAAARAPHVWVKLSAPYRFAAEPSAAARQLIHEAGPERLLWGSDWPWTQHAEITDYGATKDALLTAVGDAELGARILGRNASRLYWRSR